MRVADSRRPIGWAVRGLIIMLLLVVGWFALTRSLAAAVGETQPQWALAIAPNDSRALATQIDQFLSDAGHASSRAQAIVAAKRAIARDATNVNATVAFALDAEARGDHGKEARLFAYADRLSRRDLRTRIFFIENAVARGDVATTLRQYDIALRTSPAAYDLMFPVLAGAMTDVGLRHALANLIAANVPWGGAFLVTFANTAPDYSAALALIADLRVRHATVPPEVTNAILAHLASTDPDLAWHYYQADHPRGGPFQPVNGGFDRLESDGSPFDWQLTADNGIDALLQRDRGKGVLSFSVPPTTSGILARQLRVMPPGKYQLETFVLNIAQPKESRPYWQMVCSDGRDLGRVEIGNAGGDGAGYSGKITVPTGCKASWLQLVARSTDAIAGVSGAIDWVMLRPAS